MNKEEDSELVQNVTKTLQKKFIFLKYILYVIIFLVTFYLCLIIWIAVETGQNTKDIDNLKPEYILSSNIKENNENIDIFGYTGYWVAKNPMTSKRSDHQVVLINDIIYIIGGIDENGNATNSVIKYNPTIDEYEDGPFLPIPIWRFDAVYVPPATDDENDKIYVIGGLNKDENWLSTVYILDTITGSWTAGNQNMSIPRSDHCAAYYNGKIYVAGGFSSNYNTTLGSVEVFDIKMNSWSSIEDMPTPRGDCQCAFIKNNLIVVGGYYDPAGIWSFDQHRNEVESYNIETRSWKDLASMNHPRGDKALAVISDNHLLAIGGERNYYHLNVTYMRIATHHVEEYLFEHNVWIEKPPLPNPTFRTAAVTFNDTVYVFGGHHHCEQVENENEVPDCPETDDVQAFMTVIHPNIFIFKN